MKKRNMAMMLLTAMTLAACGGNDTEVREPVSETVDIPHNGSDMADGQSGNNDTLDAPAADYGDEQLSALSVAGTKLFAETLAAEGADSNVLISPASLAFAFGMAEGGAKGNTLSQIEAVIGGGITADEMDPLLNCLAWRMKNAADVDWNAANSIWFKDDGKWEIDPGFASNAASRYDAQLQMAAFDDATLADINSWVNSETNGRIPEILDQIHPDARMYLINALAFDAEWMQAYNENQIEEDREFTNADGSMSKVTMLSSAESRYFALNGGTGFLRDYKGGQYSFMGLLPEEGTDLNDYVKELADSSADLASAIRNSTSGTVVAKIPEFSDDYDADMSAVLVNLGMTDAFDPELADFTGMIRPVGDTFCELRINSVLHKTHMEVDRKGTSAAAATAIEMTERGISADMPICVILDRPFLYGVIDNETGLPVFLGCVNRL